MPTDSGDSFVTLDQVPWWSDAKSILTFGYDIDDDPLFLNCSETKNEGKEEEREAEEQYFMFSPFFGCQFCIYFLQFSIL